MVKCHVTMMMMKMMMMMMMMVVTHINRINIIVRSTAITRRWKEEENKIFPKNTEFYGYHYDIILMLTYGTLHEFACHGCIVPILVYVLREQYNIVSRELLYIRIACATYYVMDKDECVIYNKDTVLM